MKALRAIPGYRVRLEKWGLQAPKDRPDLLADWFAPMVTQRGS